MNHLLCGLAANPALPPELVDRLLTRALEEAGTGPDTERDYADELLHDLTGRTGLRRDQVLALAAYARSTAVPLAYRGTLTAADVDPMSWPYAAVALIDEGRGHPEWPRLLAAHPDSGIRWKLASCPGLPSDVVDLLAADPDVEVVEEVARWTDSPVTARLARHPDPRVRIAVAFNPTTPLEAVLALAEDPELPLQWALSERTDLPQALYARLAADPNDGVRAAYARNPGIGQELIRVLAADPEIEVRRAVAEHPRAPLDLLTELVVGDRAAWNPLPRVAAATPAELTELAGSRHAAVRMLVAQRRDLPAHLRDALAVDPAASVVRAVAAHPGLSEELLRAMVARHGVQVLAAVAANPDASGALLEHLTQHRPGVRRALKEVAKHPHATGPALLACLADRTSRPLAAAHPALPPEAITGLLADEDRWVAEEAAGNPSLPRAVMVELVP
ncbi:hypothetical protein GCM10010425_09150 [Streptomyces spororaveus]|uniref:Leucine rich repeat variant domain-containing protein n=1 Tax=Streptomyces spororaveus TaxID=284039 RepID=A0ABQ3TNJ7_9ACTN|nr:hypothetical protein [Streptomyces spororaveus]GHI82014.1 hypothetical protein Sspor_75750 [Streptomyces spororaveus]